MRFARPPNLPAGQGSKQKLVQNLIHVTFHITATTQYYSLDSLFYSMETCQLTQPKDVTLLIHAKAKGNKTAHRFQTSTSPSCALTLTYGAHGECC